jgi:hypothetical protein
MNLPYGSDYPITYLEQGWVDDANSYTNKDMTITVQGSSANYPVLSIYYSPGTTDTQMITTGSSTVYTFSGLTFDLSYPNFFWVQLQSTTSTSTSTTSTSTSTSTSTTDTTSTTTTIP